MYSTIKKIGPKALEWMAAKPELTDIYVVEFGITFCEWPNCITVDGDFHHLKKRSSQEAEHTFMGTVYLCRYHHNVCEYNAVANQKMIDHREWYRAKAEQLQTRKPGGRYA